MDNWMLILGWGSPIGTGIFLLCLAGMIFLLSKADKKRKKDLFIRYLLKNEVIATTGFEPSKVNRDLVYNTAANYLLLMPGDTNNRI